MNFKNEKGSITIFVLVGLLFMTAFLIIAYGANVNNSKIVKEQFNIISEIYMPNDNILESYTDAYTDLRAKRKDLLTKSVEYSSQIEIEKSYAADVANYQIYGETEGVGNLIENLEDENYGKYKITIRIREIYIQDENIVDETVNYQEEIYDIFLDEPLRRIGDTADYIDFKEQKIIRKIGLVEDIGYDILEEENVTYMSMPQFKTYEDYTNIEILTNVSPSKIVVEYVGYTFEEEDNNED